MRRRGPRLADADARRGTAKQRGLGASVRVGVVRRRGETVRRRGPSVRRAGEAHAAAVRWKRSGGGESASDEESEDGEAHICCIAGRLECC